MPINPLDALKSLLAGSPDLNAQDPTGLVHGRLNLENKQDEMARNLQLEDYAPHRSVSGAVPADVGALQDFLHNKSPNFGDEANARVKGINAANDAAIQQGFGGDSEIATPLPNDLQDHPTHPQMYANVNRSDLSPSQRLGHAQLLAAAYKEDAPVRAAVAGKQAESEGRIRENKAMFDMTNASRGPQTPPPAAPATQAGPAGPPAPPKSFLGQVKDFAMGTGPNGPGSYNSLSDLLAAKGSRMLSSVARTPQTSAIQENLLGNAQSLAGIFPSSRAAGVLHKIAQEFQSNYGNETPANSYARIRNQISDLNDAEQEFDDPSFRFKMNNGRLEPQVMNQTIERAKAAVATSRASLQRALGQIEQLHPGIGQSPIQGAPPAQRFQRLPE